MNTFKKKNYGIYASIDSWIGTSMRCSARIYLEMVELPDYGQVRPKEPCHVCGRSHVFVYEKTMAVTSPRLDRAFRSWASSLNIKEA